MKALLAILALSMLGGCAQMTNRVYCSADQRELVFVSWYARIGVAAKVDGGDAKALCVR